jgi:2-polyprenyl-6-methoxyphenol hydroxylase-like FAD-dependent oxidoreductase
MTKPLEVDAADVDVVVVGGGIGGGAISAALARSGISVEILEIQDEYRDQNRGEALSPWGAGEAERLGLGDALYDADPAPLERWVQWDEIYEPSEAPTVNLLQMSLGARCPYAIHHHRTCESFVAAARAAGATLRMGVRQLDITAGTRPTVAYTCGSTRYERRCRLVVGAGGRAAPTGRLVGLRQQITSHHWGGSLAVDGLDAWPAAVQAIGTEDRKMFFVFPQNGGRARLYLNYPTEDRRLYAGRSGTDRFLAAFDLRCLPPHLRGLLLDARPASTCMNEPSRTSTMERPYTDGVVLLGDEAGTNDTVLGTGLANALRDARILFELLMDNHRWDVGSFEPYLRERTERMRKMNVAAGLLCKLSAEFGPDVRERRRRAWARMRKEPNYMVTLMIAMAGPERVPDFATSDFLVERLLAGDPPRRPAAVPVGTR